MKRSLSCFVCLIATVLYLPVRAQTQSQIRPQVKPSIKHVVLISIDGFHPDMYLDSTWPTPNLRQILKTGTYADHLLSVFPAYTYPSHTAMVTGALPARSKVCYNQPVGSHGEWNWLTSYIKVPTIWQAMQAQHLTTAAIMWPVSVGGPITWNIPEIWDVKRPEDRITTTRQYATPGLVEEIEQNATGKLDSMNMRDGYMSLDENAGRAAAYIFKTHKPALLAVHFAEVDGFEHEQGRDGDSVRLAVETNDRAIGDIMEAIQQSGSKDSTAVIIVGDHGFATIHTVFRPNILIKGIPAKFIAAGGSAFLYPTNDDGQLSMVRDTGKGPVAIPIPQDKETRNSFLIQQVVANLDRLPTDKRNLFRIIYRHELDELGADSNAILAISAVPGVVCSGSLSAASSVNHGPGTSIQQSPLEGVFVPTHGGHHGYDPHIPEMYTGFIAAGAGIKPGGHIRELCETDISPLIAALLGIDFKTPDGKLVPGIISY